MILFDYPQSGKLKTHLSDIIRKVRNLFKETAMKKSEHDSHTNHLSIEEIQKQIDDENKCDITRRHALIDAFKVIGGLTLGAGILSRMNTALADTKWVDTDKNDENMKQPVDKSEKGNSKSSGKSRVVDIFSKNAVDSSGVGKDGPVHDMLNRAMIELTGEQDIARAFRTVAKEGDRVGIKINCISGRNFSTQVPVVMAIVDGLIKAGVKPGDIIIWDRTERELKNGGYTISNGTDSVRCFATTGYEPRENAINGTSFKLSKILTDEIDVLINVPVMKHHGNAGVSLSLKNHYGSIDNPGSHHQNKCDPHIANVCSHDAIKSKTKLIVIDALRSVCNGGPSYNPKWSWNPSRILVGFDPVAIDRIGSDIIDERRLETGLKSLGNAHRHIVTAATLGLGTDDRNQIDWQKVVV
jgi:uncharacterized protein (DUF362 family)